MLSSGLNPPKASVIHLRAADWLCLAAAPIFALMALVTYVRDGGSTMMLCSAAGGMSVLDGMVPMYVLMSAFHVAPWLRLIPRTAGVMWSKGYQVTDPEGRELRNTMSHRDGLLTESGGSPALVSAGRRRPPFDRSPSGHDRAIT